jgi:hypothetical protein
MKSLKDPDMTNTEWFWRIVDADGLADLPSDEREALSILCRRLQASEAASLKAEGERDEARRLMTQYAREAGEAKGRLEMSEAAGIVDGWRERAQAAELRASKLREALKAGLQHLHRMMRAAEMSSAIMLDRQRTGNWSGARRTAEAFDRLGLDAAKAKAALNAALSETADQALPKDGDHE